MPLVGSRGLETAEHLASSAAAAYDEIMAADDIRELLARDPFQPFRVRLTSGDHYDVRDPFSAALMKSRLFIALPHSDKSVLVPFLHVAALETLSNGRHGSPRGRRRNQR